MGNYSQSNIALWTRPRVLVYVNTESIETLPTTLLSHPVTHYQIDVIHNEDCLLGMRQLPDNSVHAIITDPPFSSGTRKEAAKGLRKSMNRGITNDEWFGTDSLTVQGFCWLMREAALQWKRVLAPGGHILVFIDWRMYPHLSAAIESADLRQAGLVVWDKTYFGMGSCFRNQHELILHFTNGVAIPSRRDVPNVIACKPIRNGVHPTEKPIALMETLLSVVSPVGGIVVDCFSGSGTTAIACINSGRHYIGYETSKGYCEAPLKRITTHSESMLGQTA